MAITSAIVFYAVIWAMVFYMINPLGQVSQGESGKVVPGTPESAPVDAKVLKKALVTTAITTVLFAILYWVIEARIVTLEDLSFMEPPSAR